MTQVKVRLLRADQVLEKLASHGMDDFDLTWIDNEVARGRLPFVKVGRRRRFREDVIDKKIAEWLDAAL